MNCNQLNFYKSETNEIEIVYCEESRISYPEHNHISVYTIGIILDGELELQYKDKKIVLKTDDLFLIYPYESHAIYSGNKGYTMISVCLKNVFVQMNDQEKIFSLIRERSELLIQKELIREEHINAILSALEIIFDQMHSDIQSDEVNVFLDLCSLLENEPEADLSIEDLAGKVYISKYHFVREFKKSIGLTPHRFQLQNRIRKAKLLLEEGMSITEVAVTTGFYDQSHFVKCFKQMVGVTPTQYRASCIEKVQ